VLGVRPTPERSAAFRPPASARYQGGRHFGFLENRRRNDRSPVQIQRGGRGRWKTRTRRYENPRFSESRRGEAMMEDPPATSCHAGPAPTGAVLIASWRETAA